MHVVNRPTNAATLDTKPARGTLRRVDGFADMKADEYRYWQSRPVHERLAAVSELSIEGYRLKGSLPRNPGLRRPSDAPKR